jgi:UDP-glucose 4-epimerase
VKVLVTGGAGYLGTELVGLLAASPGVEEVVVYDNLSRKNHNLFISEPMGGGSKRLASISFVPGDVLDSRRLRRALDGVDVVFHLAARVTTPFGHEDPHGLEQVNHWGTAELSYLLEERPPARVVYTSSTSVYGASQDPVGVHVAPRPQTFYGQSKLRGERMLERLADRTEVCVVRCGNVYGYSKSMRFDAVINRFMFEAQFLGRITVEGSGEQKRAFVPVDLACRALLDFGLGRVGPGTWDLVDQNLSVAEIAAAIQTLHPELEMIFVQQDMDRRNLLVEPDPRLRGRWTGRPLQEELAAFQARFAFTPGTYGLSGRRVPVVDG